MGERKRRLELENSVATGWSENLTRLHRHEETLRQKAMKIVKADDDLMAHMYAIEASMNLFDFFARAFHNRNDNDLIVQHLGIRLFNASASSLRLALSGYAQTAAAVQRDILETAFLLSLFSRFPEKIEEWAKADHKARVTTFSPAAVRKSLDDDDGFTERKRAKAYKILCEVAAHPTVEGFAMLRPDGKLAQLGPFIAPDLLKAVIEELGRVVAQAGIAFSSLFPAGRSTAVGVKLRFLDATGRWLERFYGVPFDQTELAELARAAKSDETQANA